MTSDAALQDYFRANLPSSLEILRRIVDLDSHTPDKPGVDALVSFLSHEFEARGAVTEIIVEHGSGNLLQAVWRSGNAGKPAMILGHLDTVFASGTAAARPFRIEDGKAYGPGVFDMKSGIAVSLMACQAFQNGVADPGRDVIFFFTSDEENGSAVGLPHLKRAAAACAAVLCLEPPLPCGGVKTSRKGIGSFLVKARGIAAHAGIDYEKGASAILELCHTVARLYEMNEPSCGISVNAGTLRGGTAENVIAEEAEAEVEIRFSRPEDGPLIESRIRALKPRNPRCHLLISGGINRPPLQRTSGVLQLYEKARTAAERFGVDLLEGGTGGGSDGSFTAAMGIPTLDGLGCRGDGAHTAGEYIEIDDLPFRGALLCRLLQSLD